MFEKQVVSLSIEGTTLRIMSAVGSSVQTWDSVPFNPHFVRSGHVADAAGLGEVIKKALVERKLTKGKVVCAHPCVGTTSRIITLPKLKSGQLESVVSREARRLIGGALDDSYLHWRLLPLKGAQQQVYLLAIPKQPLHDLVGAIRAAGLKARLIDLKPLALMRSVNARDAIIANGESNSVEVVIVLDDVPVLIRSAFLSDEMLSTDYAIGRISDELTRTISYYNDSHRDAPLGPEIPLYLTGSVAGSAPFALNVATLTGRPVEPLQPPLRYSDELPVAHYMVNMGLILRTL